MIVYHGSNSNFKHLRISKSLVKHSSTLNNEGLGIYFSTDRSVAESYGKYVYTLEINDKYFLDFRKKSVCRKYISDLTKEIYTKTNINIAKYIKLETLVDYMYFGGIAISGIAKEIELLLDSCEQWYIDVSESKQKQVFSILRLYNKRNLITYMFNYHIKNIGIIKSVDDNVVRIVNKETIN